MKTLAIVLLLIAAGCTGLVSYLAYLWAEELVKLSIPELLLAGVEYLGPILALWVGGLTLWKATKPPAKQP